jgi:GNAT superfamily N-acetyltransferase
MDLLVKLYALPSGAETGCDGLKIRRAFAAEKEMVTTYVRKNFPRACASECGVAFAREPVACFVAVSLETIACLACYDATARGFFGPIGVSKEYRGRGIGSALLHATLRDMRAKGYGYAIIGGASETGFYSSVGAIEIPDSTPGFYEGMLRS